MWDEFSISELCDALDVSRSGYHAARTRSPGRRAAASRKLVERMKVIHAHRHTRAYGSPRMTRELKGEGMACSEKRIARLMKASGLRGRPRRPFPPEDHLSGSRRLPLSQPAEKRPATGAARPADGQ